MVYSDPNNMKIKTSAKFEYNATKDIFTGQLAIAKEGEKSLNFSFTCSGQLDGDTFSVVITDTYGVRMPLELDAQSQFDTLLPEDKAVLYVFLGLADYLGAAKHEASRYRKENNSPNFLERHVGGEWSIGSGPYNGQVDTDGNPKFEESFNALFPV